MKKSILLLATVAALAPCLPVASIAATQVYDLKADWSDTQNPNGTWSYRQGDNLLINNPFPWAAASGNPYGLVAIARATEAVVVPGSIALGDIFVILTDPTSGEGEVTLRWTAPANGTINVSGDSWGTGFDWTLKHNGSALSSGESWRVSTTRDLPYQFSSGSGGATALQNIAAQAGDRVEMVLSTYIFSFGDFVPDALNFTITLTTDSVDPVAAIEALAITVFEMNLQNGIENSLDSKLDAAVAALVDANFNNDGAACNSLAAFINAVEAQRGNKLTNAQADQLIASAQEIQALLNCGN